MYALLLTLPELLCGCQEANKKRLFSSLHSLIAAFSHTCKTGSSHPRRSFGKCEESPISGLFWTHSALWAVLHKFYCYCENEFYKNDTDCFSRESKKISKTSAVHKWGKRDYLASFSRENVSLICLGCAGITPRTAIIGTILHDMVLRDITKI
jgi:hypothetical protein